MFGTKWLKKRYRMGPAMKGKKRPPSFKAWVRWASKRSTCASEIATALGWLHRKGLACATP